MNAVAFSPDGKFILTGSRDGTAKLWDVSGKTKPKTFKHGSEITALAFSSDGKYFLSGGRDKIARLWDIANVSSRAYSGHDGAVLSVAISYNGKYLLTGSADKKGRLWNTASPPATRPVVLPTSGEVNAVAFSSSGDSVLTGCKDGICRIWSLQGESLLKFQSDNEAITAACFSPDGHHILTGNEVKIATLWTTAGQRVADLKGHTSSVSALAFAKDSGYLVVGNEDGIARRWNLSNNQVQHYPGHKDKINAVAVSPDGLRILTGSDDHTAKLWGAFGDLKKTFKHTNAVTGVALSPGEQPFVWTASRDNTLKQWDLSGDNVQKFTHTGMITAMALSPVDSPQTVLTATYEGVISLCQAPERTPRQVLNAETKVNALAILPDGNTFLTGMENGFVKQGNIKNDKFLVTIEQNSLGEIFALAVSPDGASVITGGSDSKARIWDLQNTAQAGKPLVLSRHTADVKAVAFSPGKKSKFVVTGSKDGTVKLWDRATGKERATLISLDSSDWVVTTPDGQFDASPGAMQLIYYVVGREIIALDQLKKRYWDPGLLSKIIKDEPLRDVGKFASLPLYPEINAQITGGDTLKIELRERDGGLGKLVLLVNNQMVAEDLNPGPKRKTVVKTSLSQYAHKFLPGENTLTLRTTTKNGWPESPDYTIKYAPGAASKGDGVENGDNTATESAEKPHLYILCIGTSKYQSPMKALSFPDQDAIAMDTALRAAGRGMFEERIHARLLTTVDGVSPDDLSSKKNIEAAFKDVKKKSRAIDFLVVYFSGHGLTKNDQFYYLTKDFQGAETGDTALWRQTTVTQKEMTDWLKEIDAQKQVLIFDACNSGSFASGFDPTAAKDISDYADKAFDEMKGVTGTYILAGAAGDKSSYEASKYGQGLLTYSLLEGMNVALNEKRVDVTKLFDYSSIMVPKLAAGISKTQKPVQATPKGGAPIFIGIVDRNTKMPKLLRPKPLFIRPKFGTGPGNDDDLDVEGALVDEFIRMTVRGASAPLLYVDGVDANQYEDAFKISGTYTVDSLSGEVKVNVFLKKGKKTVGNFLETGNKNDVPDLAKRMKDKAVELAAQ